MNCEEPDVRNCVNCALPSAGFTGVGRCCILHPCGRQRIEAHLPLRVHPTLRLQGILGLHSERPPQIQQALSPMQAHMTRSNVSFASTVCRRRCITELRLRAGQLRQTSTALRDASGPYKCTLQHTALNLAVPTTWYWQYTGTLFESWVPFLCPPSSPQRTHPNIHHCHASMLQKEGHNPFLCGARVTARPLN